MKARQIEIRKQASLSADRHTQLIGDWAEHRIGFINGADWADRHPHWISVKKELPDEGERVLAYNGKFNEIHLCDFGLGVFEDSMGPFEAGTITHWLSLPPRPTIEK